MLGSHHTSWLALALLPEHHFVKFSPEPPLNF